ncbi:hypothetical protein CIK05_03145 [Bdellovibrio sp. qaytius]|nr:hypothetical protein CIK05_03145 [Bdellovibrio sp. qaytius]
MKLLITLSALLLSTTVMATEPANLPSQAQSEPNQEVKEKVEDIKGTIVKPTTEQTQAVSKAAVRAKKPKKKTK